MNLMRSKNERDQGVVMHGVTAKKLQLAANDGRRPNVSQLVFSANQDWSIRTHGAQAVQALHDFGDSQHAEQSIFADGQGPPPRSVVNRFRVRTV
ncbi:MAG: hypothetical protein O2968_23355 [Acidobacteria bacterium]|nr:hypothetical protein [Acidobacteriota bacterium]